MRGRLASLRRLFAPGQELVLTGMRLHPWCGLLGECGMAIPPAYWPRAARLTVQSGLNEVIARMEERHFESQIAAQRPRPPLFILGCWRSGTTWLHHLLARDPSLAAPTGLQVLHPHTFFFLEGRLPGFAPRLARYPYRIWADLNWGRQAGRPSKRVSDNVMVGLQEPAEDEFALLMMKSSDLLSHLLGPKLARRYGLFLNLRELDANSRRAWQEQWVWFLKKLTLRHGPRTLVLKSPNHTARVRTLLELFPQARFVHLHRHPFEVYRSLTRHLGLLESVSDVLQQRQPNHHETCLELYETIYSAYLDDRPFIPPGQLVELSFEQLEADPQLALKTIYTQLGLEGQPAPVAAAASYEKNRYPALDSATRQLLYRRWGRYFEAFGYELP